MSRLAALLRSHRGPALLVVGVVLAVYHYLWWPDRTGAPKLMLHWDFPAAYVPWYVYISDTLRAGIWPLWCPYVGGGVPFFINPVNNLYSPITWLVALSVGYTPYIAQVQYAGMLGVAAVGAYALALALGAGAGGACLAGICFGLSSAVYGNLQHDVFINAFALMPWLFWLLHRAIWQGRRRALVGLSFVYYMMITTAYPAIVLMMVVWSSLWALYLAWRSERPAADRGRALGGVAIAGTFALALATVFWLPIVYFHDQFTRGKPLSLEMALHGGNIHLQHAWGLVYNFMTLNPLPGYHPDVCMLGIYMSALALPFVAAGVARCRDLYRWPLLAFTLFTFGMALGEQFPPRVWLHELFPVLNYSRFPAGDSRTLFVLGMVLMAARGFAVVAGGDRPARRIGLATTVALLAALAAGAVLFPNVYGPDHFASLGGFLATEIVLAALALVLWTRIERPWARHAYLTLVAIDLAVGFRANLFVAGEAPPPDFTARFRAEHQPAFTVPPALVPRQLGCSVEGLLKVDCEGHDNLGYIEKRFYVGEYNPQRIVSLNHVLAEGLLDYLETGPRVAFWPGSSAPTSGVPFLAGKQAVDFTIERYTPNTVDYTVRVPAAGWLVFNETSFPGWRARIDGQDQAMGEALGGLRALAVTPGRHRIDTYFRPEIFFFARRVSAIALALWLVWALWLFSAGRRSSAAAAPTGTVAG